MWQSLFNWQSFHYREGVKDSILPSFGLFAWGAVVGVAMVKAGLTVFQASAFTLCAYAGTAQLAVLPLIFNHTPLGIILLTALIVNLRFLIVSASIAPKFMHLPTWKRVTLGFFTGDLASAYILEKFPEPFFNPAQEKAQREYHMGLLVTSWLFWQWGSLMGIFLADFIPPQWGVDFAGTLAVLCITLPLVHSKPSLVGAIVASVVAVFLHELPYKLGLLTALVAGMLSAMLSESVQKNKATDEHITQTLDNDIQDGK